VIRVKDVRDITATEKWNISVGFQFHDPQNPLGAWPHYAKDLLEHFPIVLFKMTDPKRESLNCNLYDLNAQVTVHYHVQRFLTILAKGLDV
jgi:hypothetical protein